MAKGMVRRTNYIAPLMIYFAALPRNIKFVPLYELYELMRHTIPSGEARYPSATSPKALPLGHLRSLILMRYNCHFTYFLS